MMKQRAATIEQVEIIQSICRDIRVSAAEVVGNLFGGRRAADLSEAEACDLVDTLFRACLHNRH